MSNVKERVKTLIDELADEDVKILIQVAERLAEWEATQEILNSPELMKGIEQGLKDIKEGRTVHWRDIEQSAPNDGL